MESVHEDVKIISKMVPVNHSSARTHAFFASLIELSKDAIMKVHALPIQIQESRYLNMNEPIPKSENYGAIPEKIRLSRFLEFSANRHIHKASVTIKHRTYHFTIMQFVKAAPELLTQEASIIIKQACVWLTVASNFAPRECSNVVNVNLYMTDAKKVLPTKAREYIEEIHANTAFTTSCAQHTTINLFRREEWFKVFIHESFHNLGMDFSQHHELCQQANAEILRAFRINSEVRLYETYCEMWAEMMNVIIRNASKHMRMSTDNVVKHVEHDLRLERAFSLFQTVKLLRHFGMKYSDFLNAGSNVRDKYKERTEVFSYFVLKSVLMFDYSGFVDWCIVNNHGSLAFQKPETHILKYARELILLEYDRPDFLRAIENIEEMAFSDKKRVKNVKFLYSTMRMSLGEL
jgi:hypothetical protein